MTDSVHPLVSIIIPVYNVEQYLCQCLDTVVNQTYENIEIICVNDGSIDNSLDILKDYEKSDPRMKVYTIDNIGLSGARNYGIDRVAGEYIMFLDSDDWIDLVTVENVVQKNQKFNVDVVLWNYIKEYESSSVAVCAINHEQDYRNSKYSTLYKRIIGLCGQQLKNPELIDSLSTAWGKLYKREIIINNNLKFVDTKLIGTEDLLFNVEYFFYANSGLCINQTFNHYRKLNSASLTHNYKPQLFSQWTEMQNRIYKIIVNQQDYYEAFNNRICLSIIGLGLNEMSSSKSIIGKAKQLNLILSSDRYIKAYEQLELKFFPIHWKLFFYFAKHKMTYCLMFLLYCIRKLR